MPESIQASTVLPVSPARVYEAWLDSNEHSLFTRAKAQIDPRVGGKFTAWDGYIEGTTVELQPPRRIVQRWRTTDFPPKSADSRLEVLLEEVEGGTKVTLLHSDIPEGQGTEYEQGWVDYYFEPLQAYFSKKKNR